MILVPEKMKKLIMIDEGFRARMYKDIFGNPTIGFGFNLNNIDLPFEVASTWMEHILEDIEYKLSLFISNWRTLDGPRQYVLINMLYNLGNKGFQKFNRFIDAIEKQDFPRAADELKKSLWTKQLPTRSEHLQKIMLSGSYNDE